MSHVPPRPLPPWPPRKARAPCCQWCGRCYAGDAIAVGRNASNCAGCGAPRQQREAIARELIDVTTFGSIKREFIEVTTGRDDE